MKIYSNRILNFAVLTAVVVVLSPREVLAQDRFERVAPASLAYTSHHPGGKYFATREEAFAAHAAAVANIEGVFSEVVSNLRPCPDGPLPAPRGQWGYINEVPHDWCHDVTRYQITPQGLVFLYSDITTAVKARWACPDGDGWIAEYRPPIFGPNRPYHTRHVCERRARLQAQCPQSSCNALGNPALGNPIFPEDGSKRQTEIDYESPARTLSFARHFHSEAGGFFHSYQTPTRRAANLAQLAQLPPNSGVPCYAGRYRIFDNQLQNYVYVPYCFPYYTEDAADGEIQIRISPNGTVMRFASSGTALDAWNAGSELQHRSVNGAPGRALIRRSTDRIDYFDGNLRLVQRSFADGRRVTLAYDGARISSINDEVGRSLSFGYDGSNRMTTMTDPAGWSLSIHV